MQFPKVKPGVMIMSLSTSVTSSRMVLCFTKENSLMLKKYIFSLKASLVYCSKVRVVANLN